MLKKSLQSILLLLIFPVISVLGAVVDAKTNQAPDQAACPPPAPSNAMPTDPKKLEEAQKLAKKTERDGLIKQKKDEHKKKLKEFQDRANKIKKLKKSNQIKRQGQRLLDDIEKYADDEIERLLKDLENVQFNDDEDDAEDLEDSLREDVADLLIEIGDDFIEDDEYSEPMIDEKLNIPAGMGLAFSKEHSLNEAKRDFARKAFRLARSINPHNEEARTRLGKMAYLDVRRSTNLRNFSGFVRDHWQAIGSFYDMHNYLTRTGGKADPDFLLAYNELKNGLKTVEVPNNKVHSSSLGVYNLADGKFYGSDFSRRFLTVDEEISRVINGSNDQRAIPINPFPGPGF